MNDRLPTEEQRKGLNSLVALALVEIRMLTAENRSKQIFDLADAFHNVPLEMYGWGSFSWDMTYKLIERYQSKYHYEEYVGRINYLQRLAEIQKSSYIHSPNS